MDYIPPSERWAKPRDIAGMWAGASINVEYFIYGAILMGFGFSFWQALSIIIIGNLSWFLVGLCSLQGPQTGTTVFGSNRAGYGPQGSKLIAFFNWLTQLGFETEGLILIVGAALVLMAKAGFHAGTPAKAVLIVVAVAIQVVLPFLGHATMVKVLKALIIPFGIVFLVLLGFSLSHAHTGIKRWSPAPTGGRGPQGWPSRSPCRASAGPSAGTTTRATSTRTSSQARSSAGSSSARRSPRSS